MPNHNSDSLEKDKVNPRGAQDRKGHYDIDGVSYEEEEVHVGSDATKNSNKPEKPVKPNKDNSH